MVGRQRDGVLAAGAIRFVVGDALDGKYPSENEDRFGLIFEAAFADAASAKGMAELEELLQPPTGFVSDVRNHVVTLHLIERVWRHATPRLPIERLHAAIFGHPGRPPVLRKQREVRDFGGRPPTAPSDVAAGLLELELQMERIMPALKGVPVGRQAVFLAHTFSSIIRVHPFEDGNGRAARLAVQLSLRVWDRPFLAIPKVRNEPAWHAALSRAVDQDIQPLVQEFTTRLHKKHGRGEHRTQW